MTPLACAAILALHAVAYYVFIAVACPVWIPGHELTYPPGRSTPETPSASVTAIGTPRMRVGVLADCPSRRADKRSTGSHGAARQAQQYIGGTSHARN